MAEKLPPTSTFLIFFQKILQNNNLSLKPPKKWQIENFPHVSYLRFVTILTFLLTSCISIFIFFLFIYKNIYKKIWSYKKNVVPLQLKSGKTLFQCRCIYKLFGRMAEWPNASVLKTEDRLKRSGGSNPSPSAPKGK